MPHIQATGFYMVQQWFAVENLTADTISDTQIDLAWDIIQAGMTGIIIEYSTDGVTYSYLDFVGGSEVTYSATGLTANTHYWFRLQGVKSGSESEYCTPADDWTAMKIVVTSSGTGAETSSLFNVLCTGVDMVVTMDGNGHFYTNQAGTTGESTTWNVVAGAYRAIYFKVTSGSSNMLFFHKNNLIGLGQYSYPPTGGGAVAFYQRSSNSPNITVAFADLPDCLTVFSYLQSYGGSVTGDLADLPSSILAIYCNGTGYFTGNISSLPDTMESLFISTSNTITGDIANLPSSLFMIYISGSNTLSGNISEFSNTMEWIYISGLNTLTGNVSGLPSSIFRMEIMGNNTISGDVSGFPQQEIITYINIGGQNTVTGDLAGLDYTGITLTYFSILGQNTISGDIGNIAGSITIFNVQGNNTISGDIAYIPDTVLLNLSIGGLNTISGDLGDLPSSMDLTNFQITGNNTITGDIVGIPESITYFFVAGNNTISGDIANLPSNISTLYVVGHNTISGDVNDIMSAITTIIIGGQNTITGDIANFPATLTRIEALGNNTLSGNVNTLQSAMRTFRVMGQNTITGTIAGIPGTVTGVDLGGLNTLSGDLADISNAITQFVVTGNNTIDTYTASKTWSAGFTSSFTCTPVSPGGLDATEIDNLFIDLDTSWTTTRSQVIDMRGTNAAPTATSAVARASLISKGRIIYTN